MSADTEQPPDKQVKDEDGKSQTAAIRRIQKLRDELADFGLSFAQNELDKQFSEGDQMRAYYRLVRQTTQQLRGVLTDDKIPQSEEYWTNRPIGRVVVHPPQPDIKQSEEEALQSNNNVALEWMRTQERLEPRVYDIVGLQQFVAWENPEWEESWELQLGLGVDISKLRRSLKHPNARVQKGAGVGQFIVYKPARLDQRIIDNAAAELQSFIRELGMGIEIDDGRRDHGFDYSDILENGPEGASSDFDPQEGVQ